MLFVDEFCGILVYIKFGADVTSQYVGELIFNLLVLVGAVRMSDRIVKELLGL